MAIYEELQIDQGSTFIYRINLTDDTDNSPYDLTNFTIASQMKKNYKSVSSHSFTTAQTNGVITISMTDEETSAITAGRYVFDVIIESPTGAVSRVMEGIVDVTPGVTTI